MFKASRVLFCTAVSSIVLVGLAQVPASANPFSTITDAINDFNQVINNVGSTVRQVDGSIRGIDSTIDALTQTLGIQPRNSGRSVSEADTTTEVLDIYKEWYKKLTPAEQEIISWLVMEYARDREVDFDTISSSEWFLQKPLQEQQLVGSLFFKLNEIMKAVADEKGRFLTYAFCVNSGGSACTP